MTVINLQTIGRTRTVARAVGVQKVRTIGDYLPAAAGIFFGATAGIVTTVLMFTPGT